MSADWISNPFVGYKRGQLDELETWWVDRLSERNQELRNAHRLRVDECRSVTYSVSPTYCVFNMSEPADDWISNPSAGFKQRQLGELETWWAERQKALEDAGYMLRPQYHKDWKPSWIEDGQLRRVSAVSLAFRKLR
jgi:hypothetical protein